MSTLTTSPSDVTAKTGPLDPTEPDRKCDAGCSRTAKPLVLTTHGPQMDLTLAWCGHCFTARERLGLLAGAVADDRREWS